MCGNSRDGLPESPVSLSLTLTPTPGLPSIPGHRAGSFGPGAPLGVILAPATADSALRLADALAAADPVDEIL